MIGSLAKGVGVGQRLLTRYALCLDSHVAFVDLKLQADYLGIYLGLGVVVG